MSKHDELILVSRREHLFPSGAFHGFAPLAECVSLLPVLANQHFFTKRGPAEEDPSLQQLIPYLVLTEPSRQRFLLYQRLKGGGEQRLHGLKSLGIGGHINPVDREEQLAVSFRADFSEVERTFGQLAGGPDLLDILRNGVLRELEEELVLGGEVRLSVFGFIKDDTNAVGQVHLGLAMLAECSQAEQVAIREDHSLELVGWLSREELAGHAARMETWSQLVLGALV